MYKSWTNVNGSNSFFVLHDGSSKEGAYSTSTVTVNSPLTANDLTTGVFGFTISSTDVPHGFNDGDLKLHANVSLGDFYRLLGVKHSKVDNDVDGWQMTAPDANTLRFRGYYNGQLSTEAYVYLHCSTSSCSIATRNYSLGSKDAPGPQLDHSTLLAKIPIQNSVLAYDSQTDEFITLLKNIKQISYMELSLRDSKGRK
eukprot:5171277-Pleurochrysis_carterae.AAC.1